MTVVIVLNARTEQSRINHVIDLASAAGSDVRVHSRTLLSVSGSAETIREALSVESCVVAVTAIKAMYPMASAASRGGIPSTVRLGDLEIGPHGFAVIAGPCSVESSEQMGEIASGVRDAGCHALRGGAFKPRSSPYAFQGLGQDGLDMLAEAGADNDLPVVTEILDVRDVQAGAEAADMIQVGARNMQNFALLKELGRLRIPILLKRGLSATVEETLLSAEYILAGGNEQVVLCERGIRTFENSYRFSLDLSAVSVLKEESHLPVIVDPSHAAGETRRVVPLALAAAAVGADGIIIEAHHHPESALCDGKQALPVEELRDLMNRLSLAAAAAGRVLVPATASVS